MVDILIDPMWQVLAVIVGLLAIFVAIGLYLLSKKNKSLTYKILSNTPVLLKKEEIKGKLEILFNKNPVENVYLIVIKLINSGNTEIEKKDYEENISIDFGENAKVLTAEISETEPNALKIILGTSNEKIFFDSVLLNRNDSFTVKALVSQFSGNKIIFGGRISGVKEIKEYSEGTAYNVMMFSGMIMYPMGIVIFLISRDLFLFGVGLSFVGMILMGIGMLKFLSRISRKLQHTKKQ